MNQKEIELIKRSIMQTNILTNQNILSFDRFLRANVYARILRNQLETQLMMNFEHVKIYGTHNSCSYFLEDGKSFIVESEDTSHNNSNRCKDFLSKMQPSLFSEEDLPLKETPRSYVLIYEFDYAGITNAVLTPSKTSTLDAIILFDRDIDGMDIISENIEEKKIEADNDFVVRHVKEKVVNEN